MTTPANAQQINNLRIQPPFWWVGMKDTSLQLLIYGDDPGNTVPELADAAGISIKQYHKTQNSHYLFIDLEISSKAQAGKFTIRLMKEGKLYAGFSYELKNRRHSDMAHKGFNSSDVVYLLMPDRFANGNPANDAVESMQESPDRSDKHGRHGGDIQGIITHLDYLQELGITALWINPLLENDMPKTSYHGYSITDFYTVDPRFGTNEDYRRLVQEAHKRGIKVIQDMVFNHCGSHHWMMKDLPMENWVHQFPEFTRSNYRNSTAVDPYAAPSDRRKHEKGWFDQTMPDLNQNNPFVATYLTQNSIWWTEYLGLNGIRMDTYPFAEKNMMARWCKQMLDEYPDFNIVGESWMEESSTTAYWQQGNNTDKTFTPALPSVTDFPLQRALVHAFTERDSWNTGLARIYYTLAQDFLYHAPNNNLIFVDNHDMDRAFSQFDGNFNAFRMAFATLLTLRGIPALYYGTEILMDGFQFNGDGTLRKDFPGGWPDDKRNAFTREGRTKTEQETWEWFQRMLNWRKNKEVIHTGQLTQFTPENGFYVYFRYNNTQTVMVILNNQNAREINTKRFSRYIGKHSSGYDVVADEAITDLQQISMPAKSARIIELRK